MFELLEFIGFEFIVLVVVLVFELDIFELLLALLFECEFEFMLRLPGVMFVAFAGIAGTAFVFELVT